MLTLHGREKLAYVQNILTKQLFTKIVLLNGEKNRGVTQWGEYRRSVFRSVVLSVQA